MPGIAIILNNTQLTGITDSQGKIEDQKRLVPDESLQIKLKKDDFVRELSANEWEIEKISKNEYKISITPQTYPIRVVNSLGKPISGVQIRGGLITPETDDDGRADVLLFGELGESVSLTFTHSSLSKSVEYKIKSQEQTVRLILPMIKDISPIGGKITGGTRIEITGREFIVGAKVRMGEKEVDGAVTDGGKKIIAETPPGIETGPQDVAVINPDRKESNILENRFVYAKPPTITNIDPKGGSIEGGTPITITGIDFLSGVEVSIVERVRVLIGDRETEIVEVDDRKIVLKSPPGEIGAQDVIVQNILINPNELSRTRKDGFMYAFPPNINKIIIPPTGVNPKGGTQIKITGTYFTPQENLQVFIGSKETTEVFVGGAGTIIITEAPPGSGEADVEVSNLTNPKELSHTFQAAFTYNSPLKASKIEPDNGRLDGGMPITITGVGFIEPVSIRIGGKNAQDITWISSKQIMAITPKSERDGIVDVLITNGDEQRDSSLEFTYNPMPIITGIIPKEGRLGGDDIITIRGKHFMDKSTVDIGGNRAADVQFISSDEIKVTTPPGREGTYDVIVTNPDGQATKGPDKYTYNPKPEITDISPEIGSPSGGTKITLSGTNFKGVESVKIGGKDAEEFEEMNSSMIVAVTPSMITEVTPSGDAGKALDVVVTNRDSQEAKRVGGFTPVRLVVNDIEPESGPSTGGTIITISGDGFIEGATVTIGDKLPEKIEVGSRGLITARIPQSQPGLKEVIVINPNEKEVTPEDQQGEGKFIYYAGFPPDPNIRVYNYPNPINVGQSTTFRYDPKKDSGIVEIKIFNMAGELIESLSDGDHDGLIPWNNIDIPPGLYPYVFILNGKIEQGQLLLVKRMK